jgi:hypothetical protein
MVFAEERAFRFVPTLANGRPAFAMYKAGAPCLPGLAATRQFEPHGIQVVWLDRQRVSRVVNFLDARLLPAFGLGALPALPSKK